MESKLLRRSENCLVSNACTGTIFVPGHFPRSSKAGSTTGWSGGEKNGMSMHERVDTLRQKSSAKNALKGNGFEKVPFSILLEGSDNTNEVF